MDSVAARSGTGQSWLQRMEWMRDAFGLVLVLVLTTYVLASLVENRGWTAVLLALATSATSVIALTSSHVRPGRVRAAALLCALTVLLAAIAAISDERTWLNLASALQVTLLVVAMAAVLRRVLTAAEVGSRTILGAISVYVALGLIFTFVYGLVDRVQGGAFFEGGVAGGSDYLFFSFTTLTTTGFGDLVPGGQPGRMISGLEMMFGQIFLVTLVAGLVSLWRPGDALRRRQERKGGGAAPS